jgi:alpha-beta hydrolase superfamily lysophospholipase
VNPNGATKVDFRNDGRAPLLFIAGGSDHIVPPPINKANVRKYAGSSAVTEYKEFRGCTHHTVGLEGWEEVADYALQWASRFVPGNRAEAAPAQRSRVLAG